MIKSAAIKRGEDIYSVPRPGRHHDVIRHMVYECGVQPPVTDEQGFITSDGRFVDRIKAGQIALETGQVAELSAPPWLFSEDLW